MTQKTGTWYKKNVGDSSFNGVPTEAVMTAARDKDKMATALKVAAGIAAVGVTLYLVNSYVKKRDLERMGPKNLRQLGRYVPPERTYERIYGSYDFDTPLKSRMPTERTYERIYGPDDFDTPLRSRMPTEYGGQALNTRQIQRLAAQKLAAQRRIY